MKKALMALTVVGLLMAGCKKEEKDTTTEKNTSAQDSVKKKMALDLQPSDPQKYLDWLVIHPAWVKAHPDWEQKYAGGNKRFANPCDSRVYNLSASRHNVGDPNLFATYAHDHSRNPSGSPINYYNSYDGQEITVASVLELMHNEFQIECYDGWLEVTIDNQPSPKIIFARSDDYSYLKSLFSEPLFQGIQENLRNLHVDPNSASVEFTHIKTPVKYRGATFNLSKIGFKLTYTTPDGVQHFEYYDMSDDPL